MNVLFIGGTKRGFLTIKALLENGVAVTAIVSLAQEEHETERFEEAIAALAQQYSVRHYLTKFMKDRDYASLIAHEIRPDVAFVVGCRILVPRTIYELPRLGTLAVHDSLLPAYRGFAPLNWSIINGEERTGVSLFYLDERMDGGDIAGQRMVVIGRAESAPEVYERVCAETVALVLDACRRLAEGNLTRVKQDYSAGSFTCSRTPADGIIDWESSTAAIYNRIRALTYPYPGAFTFHKGRKLFVWKAIPADVQRRYVGRIAGRIVAVSKTEGYADVLTADGILRLLEVQQEGGERTAAVNVLSSVKAALGASVPELLERIRQLEQQLEAVTRDRAVTGRSKDES